MRNRNPNKPIRYFAISIGLVLLAINILGFVVNPNVIEHDNENEGKGIPGYDYPTQDLSKLRALLDRPMDNFDLIAVNGVISASLVHSDKRTIQLYENWLLWLGGKFYEPLSRTQDADRIVAGGGGLCSEVSAVMNRIAERNGLEARFIGLNGHVVSEIKTENGWRVADPDYGVIYDVGLGYLEGENGPQTMKSALTGVGYNDKMIESYIEVFQSAEDNVVFDIGIASSPRLYRAELIAEWLKWLIPVLLLLAGINHTRKHAMG